MKTFILMISLLVASTQALANERYYSFAAGTWLPGHTSTVNNSLKPVNVEYDTGWGLGGTVGVALENGLRLENELVYRQADGKTAAGDQWALGWLINIWYDARNSTRYTPYFGGGFGVGRGQVASPGPVDNSGYGIAYQAGSGVDIRLDQKLSLDLGYRYFGASDTSSNNNDSGFNPAGSSLLAGLRVKF